MSSAAADSKSLSRYRVLEGSGGSGGMANMGAGKVSDEHLKILATLSQLSQSNSFSSPAQQQQTGQRVQPTPPAAAAPTFHPAAAASTTTTDAAATSFSRADTAVQRLASVHSVHARHPSASAAAHVPPAAADTCTASYVALVAAQHHSAHDHRFTTHQVNVRRAVAFPASRQSLHSQPAPAATAAAGRVGCVVHQPRRTAPPPPDRPPTEHQPAGAVRSAERLPVLSVHTSANSSSYNRSAARCCLG